METINKMKGHLKYWLGVASHDDWDQLHWYSNVHEEMQRLATQYERPVETVCGITAVLSPLVTWSHNVNAAEIILSTGMDDGVGGFPHNREKALRIHETDDVTLVTGIKVAAFFNTLLDPMHQEVTVDQWMVRAAGVPLNWKKSPPTKLRKIVQVAVTEVADDINMGDEIVMPQQVQAVIWSSIRTNKRTWRETVDKLGPITEW